MAGDAASNTASRIRPSAEQLQQIDAAAEDNTWHDAPKFSKDNWKEQARGFYGKGNAKDDGKGVLNSSDPIGTARSKANQKADESGMKEKAKAKNEEYMRRAREYMQEKMPQERKDQTIWRLKKMVLECQQHPDYSRAVQALLDMAGQYGRHGRTMANETKGTAKDTLSGFSAAKADLKVRGGGWHLPSLL